MLGDRLLAELRTVLSYNPQTGDFMWLIERNSRGGKIRIGDTAGTLKDGYVQIIYTDSDGMRHLYRAHRLAWWFVTGEMVKEIDHVDRDRANNAWANLRDATRSENNLNAGLDSRNVSGKTGVSWVAKHRTWLARLVIDRKIVFNCEYRDKEDAVAARRGAELLHLGKYCPS